MSHRHHPMYLPAVEAHDSGEGEYGARIRMMRAGGMAPPQIWHMFAFKPGATDFLGQYTQQVMRGPSPLSAGMRELIAAFTSRRNRCLF